MKAYVVVLVLMMAAVSESAAAQGVQRLASRDPYATRAELEAAAADVGARAQTASGTRARDSLAAEEAAIRNRLVSGDLRVGDKVIIELVNPGTQPLLLALNDTFDVRTGQMMPLTGIADPVPLRGVLNAELDAHITQFLLKFGVIDPQVRTTSMLGIYITGEVRIPGARAVRQDALLRDVVTGIDMMMTTSNTNKITIQRGGTVLMKGSVLAKALEEGLTIDDLQIRSGDTIDVGMKRSFNFLTVLQVVSSTAGLLVGIANLMRDRR